MSSPYAISVWEGLEQQYGGAIGERSRAHFQPLLDHYESLGMPDVVAVELVADQIARTRRVVDAGLEAFNGLVASVEVAGLSLEGQAGPDVLMRHLLETKLKIAKLYNFISTIALEADIGDVATPAETEDMVAQSEAELERWLARPE